MSENQVIYEIAQKMSDSSIVQNDMNEAAELVRQMFQKKYFNKLQSAISAHHLRCKENPSKERRLLHAFKPFLPEDAAGKLDQMMDAMLFMEMAGNLQGEMNRTVAVRDCVNKPELTNSIHTDGIYDYDTSCLAGKGAPAPNMAGLLLMLAMMNRS